MRSFLLPSTLLSLLATVVTSIPVTPAISADFPDPSIIKVGSTWYAFATAGNGVNVQIATSPDFNTWTLQSGKDALPQTGAWSNTASPTVWGPDVIRVGNTFVLYYAAYQGNQSRFHCIGAATSSNIMGPYTPLAHAWACPTERGGAIDPAGFRDSNGQRFVAYKIDGNAIGTGGTCGNEEGQKQPTPLLLQAVGSDGITPQGQPTTILDRDDSDGPLIEAPNLVRNPHGQYVLYYSSDCYLNPGYDVKYATADRVSGPYHKQGVVLKSGDFGLTAPGGAGTNDDGTKS
ncbi:glycoside hydrolase family 43 protein [Aulographum hederae CBS 113979]|uniref:Glycoside hydrolase family 43 protein n=1 Tax=Aulographum hederae CBS 113979 TaxID=1176131 RepID=A0A6G1HCB5_9PEZI|nr:glycoside hydrolase family 43 protein [Aulographum hederae CBS 113979]